MIKYNNFKTPFIRRIKLIIPSRFKEGVLKILNTSVFRKFILTRNKTFYGVPVKFKLLPDEVLLPVYLGVWESAEIYMAKKYLANEKFIIECGSSFGILALNFLNEKNACELYGCIEANKDSFNILESQLSNYPKTILKNYAIGYSNDFSAFRACSILGGHVAIIDKDKHSMDSHVKLHTLSSIVGEINPSNSQFSLIMDIEGMEYEILKNDDSLFKRVKFVVCEFENLKEASVEDQIKMLETSGFILLERYDNVVAMKNSYCN